MVSFEIRTWDIARFFYKRDISPQRRSEIILDLWKKKYKFLEYYRYSTLRIFSNEIDDLMLKLDLSVKHIIKEEIEEIIKTQDDLDIDYTVEGLYSLNKNKMEDFLKECKLRLIYECKNEFIYMKMRTLAKSSGYKKRSKKFVNDLISISLKLELSLTDGTEQLSRLNRFGYIKVMDVGMDDYIRIYNY